MEQMLQQIMGRLKASESKLMGFIKLVSTDMQTMGAALNAQSKAIAELQRGQNAQAKTLAGFNEMRVAYSPNPIGNGAPMGRTVSVPTHAPMTPQVIGHDTPVAAQASPVASQRAPTAREAEEEAVFFQGGEDD